MLLLQRYQSKSLLHSSVPKSLHIIYFKMTFKPDLYVFFSLFPGLWRFSLRHGRALSRQGLEHERRGGRLPLAIHGPLQMTRISSLLRSSFILLLHFYNNNNNNKLYPRGHETAKKPTQQNGCTLKVFSFLLLLNRPQHPL